ncbi:lytic transglycosylase domain-containing protein [Vulcanimicrobium alpinum]|nr:lytic transglycosylase domain-containing protein [Vulcanimicrobium alpinum]
MDVSSEIGAIQNRIAEITGVPPAPPVPAPAANGRFANVLAFALAPQPAGVASAPEAARPNAPVAPAQIDALVAQNASAWQVDPALLKAVIANESAFDANATSKVGAQGLMQLMPETAAAMGVRDAYDPVQNVAGGARYLRGLLDRFGGNERLAVAAYNAGPGAVEKYGDVPPYAETQTYVNNVLASFDQYRNR